MCMLLHRYTVLVILFANGIPFYNSGLVFDHRAPSIYALQCYMYLSWALMTICIVVELPFLLKTAAAAASTNFDSNHTSTYSSKQLHKSQSPVAKVSAIILATVYCEENRTYVNT